MRIALEEVAAAQERRQEQLLTKGWGEERAELQMSEPEAEVAGGRSPLVAFAKIFPPPDLGVGLARSKNFEQQLRQSVARARPEQAVLAGSPPLATMDMAAAQSHMPHVRPPGPSSSRAAGARKVGVTWPWREKGRALLRQVKKGPEFYTSVGEEIPGPPVQPLAWATHQRGIWAISFSLGILAAIAWNRWWWHFKQDSRGSSDFDIPESVKRPEERGEKAPIAPAAVPPVVTFEDLRKKESVEWVNMVLGKIFIVYNRSLEEGFVSFLQPLIDNLKKPAYVRRVTVRQFFLGEEPITIRSIERRTSRRANDLQYHIGLRYTGGTRLLLEVPLTLFSFFPVTIPVGVRDLDVDGEIWLKLRLIPVSPYVSTVTWAFVSLPKIKLALAPFRIVNLMAIPLLSQFLEKLLTEDLPTLFVRPNKNVIDLLKDRKDVPVESPEALASYAGKYAGELSVTLIEARGLPRLPGGNTDPYVLLTLGQQVFRSKKNTETSTIGPPGAPTWNQDFVFLVENPEGQVLTVRARDFFGITFTLGYGEIPLKVLQDTVPMDVWVALRSGWSPLGRRFRGEVKMRLTYKAYVQEDDMEDFADPVPSGANGAAPSSNDTSKVLSDHTASDRSRTGDVLAAAAEKGDKWRLEMGHMMEELVGGKPFQGLEVKEEVDTTPRGRVVNGVWIPDPVDDTMKVHRVGSSRPGGQDKMMIEGGKTQGGGGDTALTKTREVHPDAREEGAKGRNGAASAGNGAEAGLGTGRGDTGAQNRQEAARDAAEAGAATGKMPSALQAAEASGVLNTEVGAGPVDNDRRGKEGGGGGSGRVQELESEWSWKGVLEGLFQEGGSGGDASKVRENQARGDAVVGRQMERARSMGKSTRGLEEYRDAMSLGRNIGREKDPSGVPKALREVQESLVQRGIRGVRDLLSRNYIQEAQELVFSGGEANIIKKLVRRQQRDAPADTAGNVAQDSQGKLKEGESRIGVSTGPLERVVGVGPGLSKLLKENSALVWLAIVAIVLVLVAFDMYPSNPLQP